MTIDRDDNEMASSSKQTLDKPVGTKPKARAVGKGVKGAGKGKGTGVCNG